MRLSMLLSEYAARYSASPSLRIQSAARKQDDFSVENVGCDSGSVKDGWMFCCMRGERRDGHDFAEEALGRGASVLLTERPLSLDIPQIISSDVRKDMGRLASIVYGNPSEKLKMFAVTGTNGKSTTTWIIRHLLQSLGMRTGLIGTILYSDGTAEQEAGRTTPESCDIQRMLCDMLKNGCSACVMEASSHGLELGRLEGCRFDGGVFTNLSEEHLDYHETLERYFEAKSRLFSEHMKQAWGGGVNVDDAFGRRLFDLHPEKLLPFGVKEGTRALLRGENVRSSLKGTEFTVALSGETFSPSVRLPLPGRFNAYNALAALSTVLPHAADARSLLEALSTMVQVPGRMETSSFNNGVCCIIDFAHTPEALKNVLTEVRKLCEGRIISVFGHGGERFQPNRFSLGSIAASLADEIIVTMDNPRNEPAEQIASQIMEGVLSSERKTPARTILDRALAVRTALNSASRGDVVVISGKGPEKFLRIGPKSIPYSDGGAVDQWAKERGVVSL